MRNDLPPRHTTKTEFKQFIEKQHFGPRRDNVVQLDGTPEKGRSSAKGNRVKVS